MPFGPWPGESAGSGTLASIYAFGLGDNPDVDNLFGMPAGNLRFPGYLNRGTHGFDAEIEWFQDRAAIVLSSPPAYELISMAANNSGVGGAGGGFFRQQELNDPSWNGLFTSLSLGWNVEKVLFSTDTTQGANHQGSEFGRRVWSPGGTSPYNIPNGNTSDAMLHQLYLYNDALGIVQEVERIGGFGMVELVCDALQGGISSQFVTHWNNFSGLANAGPGWVIDVAGAFGHFNPHAALQPYQTTNDPVAGAWGWRVWAWDGVSTLQDVMDISFAAQLINGKQIATSTGSPGASDSFQRWISPVIDFMTPGVYPVGPPVQAAGVWALSNRVTIPMVITQHTGGAVTTGAVYKIGNNATHDNISAAASQTAANLNGTTPVVVTGTALLTPAV
jgi:hypothetical protein